MLVGSNSNQKGFTLVELLLAMAIFSFGLLVIVTAFLALLGFYQNGVESRIVQTAARTGVNQITAEARQSKWLAFGTNAICLESGTPKIFYADTGTYRLMEGRWDDTKSCFQLNQVGGTTAQPVTSSDSQVSTLIAEPTENNGGTLDVACTVGPCTGTSQMTSLRFTLRVTSNVLMLDGSQKSCQPQAPAFCVITALSTSVTAGEVEFQ